MKNKKIVFYTSIFGNYEKMNEIPKEFLFKDVDYIFITDNKNIRSNTWEIKVVPLIKNYTFGLMNRYYKLRIPEFLKEYKYSFYVDGCISIISDYRHLINLVNIDIPIVTNYFTHKNRDEIIQRFKKYNINPFPNPKIDTTNDILVRIHCNKIYEMGEFWFQVVKDTFHYDEPVLQHALNRFNCNIIVMTKIPRYIYFYRNRQYTELLDRKRNVIKEKMKFKDNYYIIDILNQIYLRSAYVLQLIYSNIMKLIIKIFYGNDHIKFIKNNCIHYK